MEKKLKIGRNALEKYLKEDMRKSNGIIVDYKVLLVDVVEGGFKAMYYIVLSENYEAKGFIKTFTEENGEVKDFLHAGKIEINKDRSTSEWSIGMYNDVKKASKIPPSNLNLIDV